MNTNERPALVIMAAGMGSRFGGMKQLTPVGPSGEFIIDYSIHDALTAGFSRCLPSEAGTPSGRMEVS